MKNDDEKKGEKKRENGAIFNFPHGVAQIAESLSARFKLEIKDFSQKVCVRKLLKSYDLHRLKLYSSFVL